MVARTVCRRLSDAKKDVTINDDLGRERSISRFNEDNMILRSNWHGFSLLARMCFLVACVASAEACYGQHSDKEAELKRLLSRLDLQLAKKCEGDVRAVLDPKIAQYGDFGLYPDPADTDQTKFFQISGDKAVVSFLHRGLFNSTADYFLAYEVLGEKRYLDAALKTCEFLLKAQRPEGHWLLSYDLTRSGGVTHHPEPTMSWRVREDPRVVRLQDGYQYCPFSLLLWAHRLTGDQRYFDAARRSADLMIKLQHPKNGSCPDNYDMGLNDRTLIISSREGVVTGGSYNDGATTDTLRMTLMMYHLTKDKKYLERSANIGQWMFDTQIGKGGVIGWCQQYGPNNEPISARHFEQPNVEPRVFDRFTGPMLTWFYVITGNQRYRELFEKTYQWLKSVEIPGPEGGWYFSYLTYGEPVFAIYWQTFRVDRPDTWPKPAPGPEWGTRPSRTEIRIKDSETIMAVVNKGGLSGLRKFWYTRPVKYTAEEYLDARIAAAKRALLEDFEVTVGTGAAEHVRAAIREETERRARIQAQFTGPPTAASKGDKHGQKWRKLHNAKLQYIFDVRLALGKIDADLAAKGGRGLEARYTEPWDITGDWTLRAVQIENWMDIPFNE